MSEFKVGDYIVIDQKYDKTFMPVLQILSEGKNYFYCNDGQVHKSQMEQWRHATLAESRVGCRIDNPCKCCNGHGEVGNMLESFVCPECNGDRVERNDLGDDSHIENHISPHCKSKDV